MTQTSSDTVDPVRLGALREATTAWMGGTLAQGSIDPSRQPKLEIRSFNGVKKVQAAVSPDCSYGLVENAIASARNELCLYIYNASADHLLQLLRDAKARGVRIRLMYDAIDPRGNEQQKLRELGVELKEAPSTGDRRVFTVCHQKFAVIDNSVLLIGSANWATTSIPKVTAGQFTKGNREWIVRIDEGSLAMWFKGLFEADWNIPAIAGLTQLVGELQIQRTAVQGLISGAPSRVFDLRGVDLEDPVAVTPLISPNNYFELAKDLIYRATKSVAIQQQYILVGGPRTEGLLAALRDRRKDLEIRIMVSPAFRRIGADDNWELSVKTLDLFGLKDCLKAMNLTYYTHLHNKGLIIDRKTVVVSSTNWSENSITRAREAGVVIPSEEIAGYYAEVFDFDWSIGYRPDEVPNNLVQVFDNSNQIMSGFEEIHPADMV